MDSSYSEAGGGFPRTRLLSLRSQDEECYLEVLFAVLLIRLALAYMEEDVCSVVKTILHGFKLRKQAVMSREEGHEEQTEGVTTHGLPVLTTTDPADVEEHMKYGGIELCITIGTVLAFVANSYWQLLLHEYLLKKSTLNFEVYKDVCRYSLYVVKSALSLLGCYSPAYYDAPFNVRMAVFIMILCNVFCSWMVYHIRKMCSRKKCTCKKCTCKLLAQTQPMTIIISEQTA